MSEGEVEKADNPFYCSFVSIHYIICECGETFPTEDSLKEHLELEHPHRVERKEFKCGLCGLAFPSELACVQHHQKSHLVKIIKPPAPPPIRYIIQPIKKEIDINDGLVVSSGKHPARSRARLTVRTPRPKNAKDKVCEVCGKKYSSAAALRYHQRVHTGERPYHCSYCPKTFTMPLFLQIHQRIHTGERPYACSRCPKAFGNKAALLRHDRVHTGVKPYACPQCQKTFTQSNSMKLHVHTVHLKLPAPYKSKRRREKQLLKQERPEPEQPEPEPEQPEPEWEERPEPEWSMVKTEVNAPEDQDLFYDSDPRDPGSGEYEVIYEQE